MAQDLTASGAELPAVVQAGRWKTAVIPARYAERLLAGRNTVVQYHAWRRTRRPHGVDGRRRSTRACCVGAVARVITIAEREPLYRAWRPDGVDTRRARDAHT
jgi:hypothetical protein